MNILYQTYGKVHPLNGGTERTTVTVATALTKMYGAKCYCIYEKPAQTPKEECFIKEFLWIKKKELERNILEIKGIIEENSINIVIIQGAFIHVPIFKAAAESTTCKIIFAHHFEPRWELVFGRFSNIIKHRPKSVVDFARWLKNIIIYPFTTLRKEQQLSSAYRVAYNCADHVVLLCKSFIKSYSEFADLKDESKYRVIPNGLSFDFTARVENLSKQKEVLIVSRFDEQSKRLSMALRIWKRVKKDTIASDWVLRIVGDGNDRGLYERIIRNEHIPDVSLEGRRDPIPFYKKASIFMMTSRSESWGLTLTEAQQMGVVPIAFDTYLSLHEIIDDGKNGIIIEEGDVDNYVYKIKELMCDKELWQSLVKKAIISSQRYSQKQVAKMWWQLLNEKKL